MAPPQSPSPLPRCVCETGTPSWSLYRRPSRNYTASRRGCGWLDRNATRACVGVVDGDAQCCAYNIRDGCRPAWSACAWHGEERIAWLHTPKTGTSFLLALALLANRSLRVDLAAKALTHDPTQWTTLLRWFPAAQHFRGSSLFWIDGITHAAVSAPTYAQFRGRFFAFFRDPRERGWSAYNEFVGETALRAKISPQQYARHIAGLQGQ